jgi:hypothetical protein
MTTYIVEFVAVAICLLLLYWLCEWIWSKIIRPVNKKKEDKGE